MKNKGVIISVVAVIVIGCFFNWLMLPAFNVREPLLWWWLVITLVLALCVPLLFCAFFDLDAHGVVAKLIVSVIPLGLIFILSLTGWKLWGGKSYSTLVQPKEGSFAKDIVKLQATTSVVVVDQKTAQKLGDRLLGTVSNPSWYDVDDEYNLVIIGEEAYRISPINYAGAFEYFSARSVGIPGFVRVNAKTQEAELVKFSEGMKYSPSACFAEDLARHLRGQFPTYIFGKSMFEVDDELAPYWVTSVKEPQIGVFDGLVTKSAIITNAITGESIEYKIEELPTWVDHVDSIDYLAGLVENHFSLKNGWWNLGKTDVFYPSYKYRSSKDDNAYTPFDGYNSVVASDGRVWFYMGITPANKAETNVAFVLVSPRTGEVRKYNIEGAEESSAQIAAEGLVQNLHYSASFPTIVNVGGEETYFMLLKDDAGLVKRFALCNVRQYSKVVQAETLEEAIKAYKALMTIEDTEAVTAASTATGDVTQVAQAEVAGNTYYYFQLSGSDVVFKSSIINSNLQPLKLVEGANVTVQYQDSEEEPGIGIVTKINF